jgi:5-methyltetrahydropteroyltriglutamate--homocysteine methyltransferase
MDFAAALNAEIKDLFAAGADIVQVDEPWMQQHPDKARRYGVNALDRALEGAGGTIAVHLCFGYALWCTKADRLFVPAELEQSAAQQISIEAAQPKLDLAVLKICRRRRSSSVSSTSPTERSRRRRSWRIASAGRSAM